MASALGSLSSRAEAARAFILLYGYTAGSALGIATAFAQALAQLASSSTLESAATPSREGSVVLSDLYWRVLEVSPQWAGLGGLWLIAAAGSLAPKLYWLRCLSPRPRPALTVSQGLRLMRQVLVVRIVAGCAQLWCWGLGWCTGVSIATLLRQSVDERFVSLWTWGPLVMVAPWALGIGALEQMARIVLVGAQRREAEGTVHPLCGYTIREAIAAALTSTRRYPLRTVGVYLLSQTAPLLALVVLAAGMTSMAPGQAVASRVIVHQLAVLLMLALGGGWQYHMVRLLQPPTPSRASTGSASIHL